MSLVAGRSGKQTMVCCLLGVLVFLLIHVLLPYWKQDIEVIIVRDRPKNESPAIPPAMLEYVSNEEEAGSRARSETMKARLKNTCDLLNISLPINAFMLSHMHFDHNRKALYCFVPKVACTSWKRVWMKLTGVVPPDKDLATISRLSVHTSLPVMTSQKARMEEVLTTYKKFMFVRHPFDRVLSAYKDKLESEDKQSSYNFHKQIGAKIQKKYRGISSNGHNTTFSEFIRFISEPGPGTFEQRNEHWLPMHEICNPCKVQYDFIGKYEHLSEDANYVLDWIKGKDLVDRFPSSDRPFHARRYDPRYFNQLSHEEKVAFFNKYILDFVTFDYQFV